MLCRRARRGGARPAVAKPAQVVVTDQRMPEMSGVDLLARVRERRPDVVRMMLDGYTEMDVAVDAINRGAIHRLITKPLERRRAARDTRARRSTTRTSSRRSSASTSDRATELQAPGHEPQPRGQGAPRGHRAARRRPGCAPPMRTIRALCEAVDAKDAYTRGDPSGWACTRRNRAREDFPKASSSSASTSRGCSSTWARSACATTSSTSQTG